MSAECERIKLFRTRQKAVSDLYTHLSSPDASLYLWKTVIAFQGYPFHTSGRGSRPGVKFTYEVSKSGSAGGRHYEGEQVDGYGNEMWIIKNGQKSEKSISRSTVDFAMKNAREKEIKGPKALGIPGAGSYLYPMFLKMESATLWENIHRSSRWNGKIKEENGQFVLDHYSDVESLIDLLDERYTRSDITDTEYDTDVE